MDSLEPNPRIRVGLPNTCCCMTPTMSTSCVSAHANVTKIGGGLYPEFGYISTVEAHLTFWTFLMSCSYNQHYLTYKSQVRMCYMFAPPSHELFTWLG